MSYLVLARKYRPQTFEQVVGQAHVTQTLKNSIQADRVAHALLFAGPRGIGKTSVARILAKAMNCEKGPAAVPCNTCTSCKEITKGIAVDVLEIDGASNRGIDEIREIRENIKYMPGHSRYKIYIIDEVHMLTAPAFNALLKTLEEPPAHVLFIFATTEANRIPVTILSRCQWHDFRRIGLEDILKQLAEICRGTSFEISQDSLMLLAREADGSMRDALSLLDQVMAYCEKAATDDQVLDILGAVDRKVIFGLSSALLARDAVKALTLLDELYNRGHDLKRLSMQMAEHFRHLLIVKMGHGAGPLVEVPAHELTLMEQQVESISFESLNQVFNTLFEAETGIRLSPQPKLAMEMLFIKLCQLAPVVPFDEIIKKLEHLAKEVKTDSHITEVKEVCQGFQPKTPSAPEHTREPEKPLTSSMSLSQIWQELLVVFSEKYPALVPNLEKAILSKIGSDFIEITVTGNSFCTARLQDKKSMATLQEVCHQYFKRNLEIKIVESGKGASQKPQHKELDRTKCLKKEALAHSLVKEALGVFQGKVIDVKIL
ncbi:MAG: DNA polymerase III, subunit gamma and tau [Desulfobacterales bacterium S5133MH4]|nr:MAG: DNA polymerase III, subunit gamma and tau [Desulfobacterales bacterium S5133MH4]